MDTQQQHAEAVTDHTATESKRDGGVYVIIAKDADGQLFFGEFPNKKAASVAYSDTVEKFGPNSILRFYKQAKQIQVQTKTVTHF